jgi:hypothetical protein
MAILEPTEGEILDFVFAIKHCLAFEDEMSFIRTKHSTVAQGVRECKKSEVP